MFLDALSMGACNSKEATGSAPSNSRPQSTGASTEQAEQAPVAVQQIKSEEMVSVSIGRWIYYLADVAWALKECHQVGYS